MILPDDVVCLRCAKCFCCNKCRLNHEAKVHFSQQIQNEINEEQSKNVCPLCNHQPLAFKRDMSKELLLHITKTHLPLRCKGCSQIYENESDLKLFTQCDKKNQLCKLNAVDENSKVEAMQSDSYSARDLLQPSPVKEQERNLTPLSLFNLRWKTKLLSDHCAGDNGLSLRNVSSINDSSAKGVQNTTNPKKLVRTTSTPMQTFINELEQCSSNTPSCHMSSIFCSSDTTDLSPACNNRLSSLKAGIQQQLTNRRSASFVTPLRQVMSDNIRRAILEHGLNDYLKSNQLKIACQDNTDSFRSPLDLRTSPSLRRTYSDSSCYSKLKDHQISEVLYSSKKLTTTESVFVASTINSDEKNNTIYKTCRSVQVLTTELTESENKKCSNSVTNSFHHTPKFTGVPLKKTISFDSPSTKNNSDIDNDVFYTPKAAPSKSFILGDKENANLIKKNENNENKKPAYSGLWSLIPSVMRLPYFGSGYKKKENNNITPLVQTCSSFPGVLKNENQQEEMENRITAKRKRSSTVDRFLSFGGENSSKRFKKIQCRKPIQRMCTNAE